MSWSIKKIGKREAVRTSIENETNLPDSIKACILSVLGEEPNNMTGVRVEGYGHQFIPNQNSSYSSIGKLEVEPMQLVG